MAPNQTARFALAGLLTSVGVIHYVKPESFDAIIPDPLPAKRALTYASGALEIGTGLALAVRPSRRLGWLIAALMVAVFPANVNMALKQPVDSDAKQPPKWILWARLPLQAVFIWAALAATRPTIDAESEKD